jgi:uncharacterized integral membrane protein
MKLIVRLTQILAIVIAAIFAISNPQDVTLNLWPFPISLTMPVYVAVLVALAAGLLIGSGFSSISRIRSNFKLRRAERRTEVLETASAEAEKTPPRPALPAPLSSAKKTF